MKEGKFKLRFKISENVHTYSSVTHSLNYAGLAQTDSSNWNILWSAPLKVDNLREFNVFKHCNHFAGAWNLGRKDSMYRNISAYQREFGDEYILTPKTWVLPQDYQAFKKEREESEGIHKLWILKPANSSCGRGIRILN